LASFNIHRRLRSRRKVQSVCDKFQGRPCWDVATANGGGCWVGHSDFSSTVIRVPWFLRCSSFRRERVTRASIVHRLYQVRALSRAVCNLPLPTAPSSLFHLPPAVEVFTIFRLRLCRLAHLTSVLGSFALEILARSPPTRYSENTMKPPGQNNHRDQKIPYRQSPCIGVTALHSFYAMNPSGEAAGSIRGGGGSSGVGVGTVQGALVAPFLQS